MTARLGTATLLCLAALWGQGCCGGDDEESADRSLQDLVDPAGSFYRYGMSASLLGRARDE